MTHADYEAVDSENQLKHRQKSLVDPRRASRRASPLGSLQFDADEVHAQSRLLKKLLSLGRVGDGASFPCSFSAPDFPPISPDFPPISIVPRCLPMTRSIDEPREFWRAIVKNRASLFSFIAVLFLTALPIGKLQADENKVFAWKNHIVGTYAFLGDYGGGANTATVCDTADRYRDWLKMESAPGCQTFQSDLPIVIEVVLLDAAYRR
jgi:hypothetical protein